MHHRANPDEASSRESKRSQVQLRDQLALAFFALIVSSAVVVLWVHGYRYEATFAIVEAAVFGTLIAFTWFVTRQEHDERLNTVRSPWLQVAACLISVVISGVADAIANGALSLWTRPIAGLPRASLTASGAPPFSDIVGSGLAQFVLYVLITASLLLPFRVPPRELYLQLNLRASIPVGVGWIVPEIAVMAYRFTNGAHGFFDLGPQLLRNVFQNGFSEEFLFRGALLTRLANVISIPWTLVVQAVIFGFWHLGADMRESQGHLAAAFGFMAAQMLFGLAMGFIAIRARSLLVPSIVHVLFDALPL